MTLGVFNGRWGKKARSLSERKAGLKDVDIQELVQSSQPLKSTRYAKNEFVPKKKKNFT